MALTLSLIALCFTGQANAQSIGVPCLYEDYLSVISLDANVSDIRIEDNIAYMLTFNEGVLIYDYSIPTDPVLLSSVEVFGNGNRSRPEYFEINDSMLYVSEGGYGLYVFDVSDPSNPVEISVLLLDADMEDVVIRGEVAYVTSTRPGGFYTIDISDPATMSLIGALDVACRGVCLSGDYAYLAADDDGVHVVDISDLANPALVTTIDIPEDVLEVGVSGTLLVAIGSGTAHSYTIDISDPSKPAVVGQFNDAVFALDIIFHKNLGYVTGRPSVHVYDFADPSMPHLLGVFDTFNDSSDIAFVDGIANVPTSSGARLYRIDVSNPTNETAYMSQYDINADLDKLVFDGNVAYVASTIFGVIILDISDPLHPVEIGVYDTPAYPTGLFVADGYAYVIVNGGVLQIVDVTDPTAPALVGEADTNISFHDVCVVGNTAVLTGSLGLYVIDVSDKQNPVVRGSIPDPIPYCSDVPPVAHGGYIYWTGCDSGMRVVDVSNPDKPKVVGSFMAERLGPIAIQDDIAVVGAGSIGFYILDVADPINPTLLGYGPPTSLVKSKLENDRFYAMGTRGIQIFDVQNPSDIVRLGFYESEFGPERSIELRDEVVYLLASGDGIILIDVSDCEVACIADVNGDGVLSPADFSSWVAAFNAQAPECDQNGDGSCTPADFSAWVANYNAGC